MLASKFQRVHGHGELWSLLLLVAVLQDREGLDSHLGGRAKRSSCYYIFRMITHIWVPSRALSTII